MEINSGEQVVQEDKEDSEQQDDGASCSSMASSSSSGEDSDDDPSFTSGVKEQSRYRKRRKTSRLPAKLSKEWYESRRREEKIRREDASEKYKCDECDFTASYPSQLRRHNQRHHLSVEEKATKFTCSQCGEKFPTYPKLRSHVAGAHPMKHECEYEYCDFTHRVLANVRRHMTLNHEQGVKCTIPGCEARYAKPKLKAHLLKAHGIGRPQVSEVKTLVDAQCQHCEYTTPVDCTDVDAMNKHVERAHGKGVKCPYEGCEESVQLVELDRHLAEHEQPVPKIGNVFSSDDAETSNTLKSSSSVAATSEIGDDTFFGSDQGSSSSSDDDGDDDDYIDVNETVTKRPKQRKKKLGRMLTETGEVECTICDKRFLNSIQLKRHSRRVHEHAYAECKKRRQRRYLCDWENEKGEACGKTFATPGLLDDHLNLHQGKKPYECAECQQSFHARARFAVHLSKYHQTSIKSYTSIAKQLPIFKS